MITELAQTKVINRVGTKRPSRVVAYRRNSEPKLRTEKHPSVGIFIQGLYNRSFIRIISPEDRPKKTLNVKKLESLSIPNFAIAAKNGVRGESLSSRKNRKHLKQMKKCGITTIIDLRDKYKSQSFPEMCKKNGLKYYNIPIDSSSVQDKDVIKNLPLLFKLIDDGRFYLACAQGLHRTDIALSLNYVFNPKATEPPILKGHIRGNEVKFDDIARRLNSVRKNLTSDNIKQLGWGEDFQEQFLKRKKELLEFNKKLNISS